MASAGPYASLHLAPDRQPHQYPPLSFLQDGCPSWRPTNRVKALKAYNLNRTDQKICIYDHINNMNLTMVVYSLLPFKICYFFHKISLYNVDAACHMNNICLSIMSHELRSRADLAEDHSLEQYQNGRLSQTGHLWPGFASCYQGSQCSCLPVLAAS